MTIKDALLLFPTIESDLLLAHILRKPKEFLYVNPDTKVSFTQIATFKKLAAKRMKGMPMAYILGYKYFFGLKFKVNAKVLIPRPETEWLVEKALSVIKSQRFAVKKKIKIIDIGTGSGCIAVSIAKHIDPETASVHAIDISAPALKVAAYNALQNNVSLKFCEYDALQGFKGKFDIMIANLPYVPASDYRTYHKNLRHEPRIALTDGTDTFELLRTFIEHNINKIAPGGILLMETDPASINILRKLLKNHRGKVMIQKDLNKLNRFIVFDTMQKT